MDSIISLYRTNSGRISRKGWWLGVVGLIVASIIITLILSLVGLGFSPWAPAIDPAHPEVIADIMRKSAWGSLITFVILAYPSYNLSLKRRHDRNNSGLDFIIYLGLTALLFLAQALGLGMTVQDVGGVAMPMPAPWFGVVTAIMGIYALYLLVVLGFLRGTVGENSYGADPAGGEWTAAA